MISSIGKTGIIVSTVLVAAMVVAYAAFAGVREDAETQRGTSAEHDHTYSIEAMEAFDVRDENKLVGFADNVFVGRVVEKTGEESPTSPAPAGSDTAAADQSGMPRTQFAVEVLDNIKGDLKDTVTVSQFGGSVPGQKDAVALVEEDAILKPGQTVLFVTRFDRDAGWHQITTANFGDKRIEGADERDLVVKTFEEAKEKQVDPLAAQKGT